MSPLEVIQLDMAARLNGDDYFATIPIFVLRPRASEGFVQIQTRIDQAINAHTTKAGKSGAAVTVLMPLGEAQSPNVPGPRLDFTFVVRVQELPIVNMNADTGTLKSAEEIALRVAQMFHHWQNGSGQVLVAASGGTMVPNADFDPKLTYDVKFRLQTGLGQIAKTAAVGISPASGAAPQTVTLSCGTVGALIFYSIDGSYPSLPYGAPVAVSTAGTLRAVATSTGRVASDISQGIFT